MLTATADEMEPGEARGNQMKPTSAKSDVKVMASSQKEAWKQMAAKLKHLIRLEILGGCQPTNINELGRPDIQEIVLRKKTSCA